MGILWRRAETSVTNSADQGLFKTLFLQVASFIVNPVISSLKKGESGHDALLCQTAV